MAGHRVLYIEDNPDNQRLVRRVLEARGYEVQIAEDGPTGLDLARLQRPDLILVDINIPGLDGHETTTRLRSLEQLQGVPMVALTADGRPGVRERSLAAGCVGYITKPIDVRYFPDQILAFINGWRETLSADVETEVLRTYTSSLVERLERKVQELATANAELKQLDQMKSQFIATLSHELRTPMTSILGYLALFDRGTLGALTQQQSEALRIILRNSRMLSHHINSLLYLQEIRSSELKMVSFPLDDLVRRVVRDYAGRLTASGLDLHLEIEPTTVHGDVLALDQAIRHVLDNAIKFTPSPGNITIVLRNREDEAELCVHDTGIGIPSNLHKKIFEPFYRIDNTLTRQDAGVGIGLTIVTHVIDAHQGQIDVQSASGAGSVFTLRLPR
jgi:signal transduction histidine kinase